MNCISLSEKMALSHRSLISNKPCWVKKEKAGLTIVFQQQMNSRKVFFKRMSARIALGSSQPSLKIIDEPRGVSHYIAEGPVNDTSKKALGTIQVLRKGIPFIYQGQEIGMENQVFESVEDFDDIATINGYHVAKEAGLSEEEALAAIANYSRDNARTPMTMVSRARSGI